MNLIFVGKNFDRPLESGDVNTVLQAAVAKGHNVWTQLTIDADALICVDFCRDDLPTLRAAKRMGIPRILVKQEPPVILLDHREPNPGGFFTFVLERGVANSSLPLYYPNSWQVPSSNWIYGDRLPRFVSISADKWSAVDGELYTLRREAYALRPDLDLYGRGWGKSQAQRMGTILKEILIVLLAGQLPKFPNFRVLTSRPLNFLGEIDAKLPTLQTYDYSLVIENSYGYMSEKLVDSLLAGTLPVYVGPPAQEFGIPPEFVLQASPTFQDLEEKMNAAKSSDLITHRKMLWDWLSDPATKRQWDAAFCNADLITRVELLLGQQPGCDQTRLGT